MSDSELTITSESMKRSTLISASGRIDSSNVSKFEEALQASMDDGTYNIIIELSGVHYMSSAALRAMVSALRDCKKRRGDVRLAQPSERVQEVLSLAGLDTLFEVYDSTVAAVGSF